MGAKKFFLAVILVASHRARAQFPGGKNYELNPQHLSFSYSTYDGEGPRPQLQCQHSVESKESQDWRVVCGNKIFSVHLWLTEYRSAQIPKLSLELLYWVTDRSDERNSRQHGSTVWYRFREYSELDSLLVKQGVDNDTAGLYLEIKLPR